MSPDDWQRVSTLLDQLLELDKTERSSFLDKLRHDDPTLCREVESLLDQDQGTDLFDAPPLSLIQQVAFDDVPATDPMIGGQPSWPAQAGRFEIRGEIARGGMGAVLRAFDPEFGRTLAVKVLLPGVRLDADAERRFLREAQITGRLQHPGIPPIHELGRLEDNTPFFAMKLIEGRTLSAILASSKSRKDPSFIGIFEQICRTLGYAHDQGIIHRDLKPGNVMVGAFGEVQVMDWGLAKELRTGETLDPPSDRKHAAAEITRAGDVSGTPAYMAPEQARGETGKLDERCDVFGLGAILCAILTGRPPFAGTSAEMLRQSSSGDLSNAQQRLAECGEDEELVRIAQRCLAPQVADRYRHGGEVADAVTAYREGVQDKLRQAELEREKAQVKVAEERRRRRLALTLAGVLLVLLLCVAGAGLWYQQYVAQRDARAEHLNGLITQALDHGEKERQQLTTRLTDPRRIQRILEDAPLWQASLHSMSVDAEQARKIADSDPALLDGTVSERLQAFEKTLALDRADEDFSRHFDTLRLDFFHLKAKGPAQERIHTPEGKPPLQALAAKYAEQFRMRGWDIDATEPAALAESIRATPVRYVAAAALDGWAWMALADQPRDEKRVQRLLELARLVDPDPWRDGFRQWKVWSDEDALRAQLKTLKHEQQPPHILSAAASLKRQHGESATDFLRLALFHHPNNFWLNADLGMDLLYTTPRESVNVYRTALALRPTSPVVLNNLGLALANSGEWDAAMTYFNRALDYDPSYVYARCNLAKGYYQKKDYSASIEQYHKALAVTPKDADIHNDVAISYFMNRDIASARKHFETALGQQPNNVNARRNLAAMMRDLGQFKDAVRLMREVVEAQPKYASDGALQEYECVLELSASETAAPVEYKQLEKGIKGELTSELPVEKFIGMPHLHRASYRVALKAGRSYQVDLTGDFDTFLKVEDANYKSLVSNDDIRLDPTPVNDSRLIFTPEADGIYRLVVSAAASSVFGSYELRVREVAPVGPPLEFRGELFKGDRNNDGKHFHMRAINVIGNQPYVITLQSEDFDTAVGLIHPSDSKFVGWPDKIKHGNPRLSRLHVTTETSAQYRVYVTTAQRGATGVYRVTIQRYALK